MIWSAVPTSKRGRGPGFKVCVCEHALYFRRSLCDQKKLSHAVQDGSLRNSFGLSSPSLERSLGSVKLESPPQNVSKISSVLEIPSRAEKDPRPSGKGIGFCFLWPRPHRAGRLVVLVTYSLTVWSCYQITHNFPPRACGQRH